MEHGDLVIKTSDIVKKSESHFGAAFWGLEPSKKRAMNALYAYCRLVDDIADESLSVELAQTKLNQWKLALLHQEPVIEDLHVWEELIWAMNTYGISKENLLWILNGVEKDLIVHRYKSMPLLIDYCDAVASAVGFCCMSIFGVDEKQSSDYVFATGRALQLTNILRDVDEDLSRGRIYLPQDLLEEFGVGFEAFKNNNPMFINMLNSFSQEIETYYQESLIESKVLALDKVWPAEIMKRIYFSLFLKIKKNNFAVMGRRYRLSIFEKAWVVLTQPKKQ